MTKLSKIELPCGTEITTPRAEITASGITAIERVARRGPSGQYRQVLMIEVADLIILVEDVPEDVQIALSEAVENLT